MIGTNISQRLGGHQRLAAGALALAAIVAGAGSAMAAAPPQGDLDALLRRGLAAFERSEWATAIGALEEAVHDPEAPLEAWMYLGLSRWRTGDRAGAAAALSTAMARWPDQGRLPLLLGLVRFEQRRLVDAREALERARELMPDDPVVHLALGRLRLNLLQFDAAEESLERARELDPDSAAVVAALGTLRFRQGALEDARARLQHALQLDPDDREARFLAASAALRARDAEAAEHHARELLGRDPLNERAHYVLAAALEAQGRDQEAAAERETYRALVASAEDSGAGMATGMPSGGGRGAASQPMPQPGLVSPARLLQDAEAARREGFLDRAAQLARLAMSMDPEVGLAARHTLAIIHMDRGDDATAADLLAGLWREGVRDSAVAHDLALAYIGDGWPEIAVEVLVEATGLGTGEAVAAEAPGRDDTALHQILAVAAMEAGQVRLAVAAAERAVELAPERAVLHRILSDAYGLAGEMEKAAKALRRYEELARLEQ